MAGKTRTGEKAGYGELCSLLPQGLLFQLPWETFPTPGSRPRASLFPRRGHTKRGRSHRAARSFSLSLQLWRHLTSLGSTQWLSNLFFPKLKKWSGAP